MLTFWTNKKGSSATHLDLHLHFELSLNYINSLIYWLPLPPVKGVSPVFLLPKGRKTLMGWFLKCHTFFVDHLLKRWSEYDYWLLFFCMRRQSVARKSRQKRKKSKSMLFLLKQDRKALTVLIIPNWVGLYYTEERNLVQWKRQDFRLGECVL